MKPIVIRDKKTIGEVKIYVELRNLNDACMHDPFPTPFIDEVLESVGGQEMYSFTDGFSGYHQVIIMKEYSHKMNFEWECYQYTVIPFGIKNTPAIFSRIIVSAFKYFIHKFLELYFDDWNMFVLVRYHIDNLCRMLGHCR